MSTALHRTATRTQPSRTMLLIFALMLIAAALRIWLISVNLIDPRFSNADDGDYYRRALRVAVSGVYLDDAWLIRPPGHVAFFAAWLWLALMLGVPQYGVLFVQLAQAALGVALVPLGYGVASRMFGSARAGLVFAGFLAVWFPFVEMPTVLFSEPLYLFLFMLHLWLLLRFDATGRRWDLAWSGVALGFAALTRSPALYALAFVAVWLYARQWRGRLASTGSASVSGAPVTRRLASTGSASVSGAPVTRRLASTGSASVSDAPERPQGAVPPSEPEASGAPASAASVPRERPPWLPSRATLVNLTILAACCLAVVAPWTLRNYVVYQRFIPVDTLGGINLWLDLDRVDRRDLNISKLRELPQADRQAFALAQARAILAADPLKPLRDIPPTFQHIWKAQFVEDYFLKSSFFTRPLREAAPLGLFGDLLWLVLTLAGLIGLAGPPREGWHNRLYTLAWLGYSVLTVLVFHVEPRYLIPIWTLVGLYGAGTIAGTSLKFKGESLKPRRLPTFTFKLSPFVQVFVALAFLALVFTYRDYPQIIARGVARERALTAADAAYLAGDVVSAERGYRAGLAAQPEFVDAQVTLALTLAAQRRDAEALALVTSDKARGLSRRADLVAGALLRETGQAEAARKRLALVETNAGEDIQRWALTWLRPLPQLPLTVGGGLDLGYLQGFSPAETEAGGRAFRWLEGQGALRLVLDSTPPPGSTLELLLSGGPADTPLTLRFSDGSERTITVAAGQWRRYQVLIPVRATGTRELRVQLSAPTFIPSRRNPASDDARTLSLMVAEVRVQ